MKIYGYCRISTIKQNIDCQVRNISKEYPDAIIIQEKFTGSIFQGRKELEKLISYINTKRSSEKSMINFNPILTLKNAVGMSN